MSQLNFIDKNNNFRRKYNLMTSIISVILCSNHLVPRSHIDDEYSNMLYTDPQILITTSRDPSSRLLQFLKEMAIVIPNS